MTGDLPTCVDCHGSHEIVQVEDMDEAMPANCLTCHTDQTPDWTADFIASRPGLGVGADGYGRSARCSGCHEDLYATGHDTLHATVVQNPALDPQAIVADFDLADPDLMFGLTDLHYVIGSRRRQVFLTTATVVTTTSSAACHGGTAGLDLDSYAQMMEGDRFGPAIVPGDPEGSLLVQLQREGRPSSLAPRELEWIVRWIEEGAPES